MGETRKRDSVHVNSEGKKKLQEAKAAKHRNYDGRLWTDLDTATEAGISEKTVERFFNGKTVSRQSAISIAKALDLKLTDLMDVKATTPPLEITATPIDSNLIQQVQEHCRIKILNQHGIMRLLSGDEIGVDQLYVDVWLLNRPPHTFQVSPSKLLETFDLRNDRYGLGDRIRRNKGFEIANANAKLMILGKPGAGKTTFLKHLAVDWCNKKFQPDLIAVFIELRRIRDRQWYLLDAIDKELGFKNWKQVEELLRQIAELERLLLKPKDEHESEQTKELRQKWSEQIKALRQQVEELRQQVKTFLEAGKLLVLMDGLDEVSTNVLRQDVQIQLRQIVENYPSNRFILTCRTQIIKSIPNGFTSVEVADFNPEQVKKFVQNWFTANGGSDEVVAEQWEMFEHEVDNNSALKELTVTPVLLSLMCLVLQDAGEMPSEKAWLYQKGIRLMLSKWNDAKAIDGWEVGSITYRQLDIEQKEALLTEIAARKFENPKNFVLFEQKEIAAHITKFLRLADSKEGIAVLKAIETQHGLLIERADELWSYSHLTFQEHFTVQWLTQLSPEQLAEKVASQQWQEVVKQLVKSQQPSDRLLQLIKQAIDQSIANDSTLNQFLTWVLQKSESIQTSYRPAAIRDFYFALGCARDRNLALALTHARADLRDNLACKCAHVLNLTFTPDFTPDFALDFALTIIRARARNLAHELSSDLASALDLAPALDFACVCAHNLDINPEIADKLRCLKVEIPLSSINDLQFQQWWQANHAEWLKKLYKLMTEHRNVGHDWKFTDKQKHHLQRYYTTNKFLVDLMNIEGAASDTVCAKIENALLLPWAGH